ncbi:prefoldin subunit 4 [Centruroides vittatus]|uniref:prefoldin subunit 4 n=1 Tax=Centruroides vittatus TaxID=120091 RepID=UPI00351085AF
MAATTVPSGSFHADSDIQVTYEDQQKINKFARQNARLEDLSDELKLKQKELQNLEDAKDELLMLDENDTVPYMLGEVFVNLEQSQTEEMLNKTEESINAEMANIQANCEAIKQTMSELKVQLYAKFGSNINLEPDDN